jgi:hypothetical protein
MNVKRIEVPLKELTSITYDYRRELLMWFARMTLEEQQDVLHLQRDLIRSFTGQKVEVVNKAGQKEMKLIKLTENVALAALVNALAKRKAMASLLDKKQGGKSEVDLARLKKMRIDALKQCRREGDKEKRYRQNYRGLVGELRSEGLGWRMCAKYLKKNHRFAISHQRLMQLHEKYDKIEDQHSGLD